ncbi:MAG TPA: STAS/SEC14 domain-containing protein [Terriglobales bacterium]|nr:STAS/SEC14 domain-containing protein [Terriglobales bacterium]
MDDRIHFIEHQGKRILLLDFSHANAHEMQLLHEYVRVIVAQHGHESVVTLADFTGATVDHTVATRIKEVLALDRPFVKKTAWVGTESIPHALMESFHNFSQREIATFKTREEAMDWLAKR